MTTSIPVAPVAVMAIGAVVAIGGSLTPWVRTGSAARNSYDLFAVIERLGFAPDGAAETALRWWPLVPVFTVGAVAAASLGLLRIGGCLGLLAACYAGGTALAVTVTAPARVVSLQVGPLITAIGAVVLLVGSIITMADRTIGLALRGRRAGRRGGPS